MAKWFVDENGHKSGPFSDDEFFDHLKDKDPARVQIWREGMSAWVLAADLPPLAARMKPQPDAKRRRGYAKAALITLALLALIGAGAWVGVSYLLTESAPPPEPAVEEKAAAAPAQPAPPSSAPPAQAAPPPPAPAPRRLTREEFSDSMRQSMSLLDSLNRRFPKQYDDLAGEFYDKLASGYPEAETAIAMRRKGFDIIKALLPLADDDVLLALNAIIAEKYRVLNSGDPALCHAFGTGSDASEITASFSEELLRRERDLYERAILTAASRPAPDTKKITNLQAVLRRAMLSNGVSESQFALLDAPGIAPAQYADYCQATTMLFREIGRLAQDDAATVMRRLLSGK